MDWRTENDTATMKTGNDQSKNLAFRPYHKLFALALVLVSIGLGYWLVRDYLTIEFLADKEDSFRSFQSEFPWLVVFVGIAIYAGVAGLSLSAPRC